MRKKVGLALSSGGARGLAHIGVIKVLEKHNIPIDYISGTSMGAMVGAYYALHNEIQGLEKMALGFRKRDLLKLFDMNDPRISLLKGEKVRKFLQTYLGDKTFEETKIPLRLGATTLEEGKKVIFKKGSLVDALMASGAVPGVFPVVKHKGKHLVDGGLADATPVDIVKQMGADVIIAVDLFFLDSANLNGKDKITDVLERTYEIIMSKLSNYRAKEYGSNIIVLNPKIKRNLHPFAFYNAKKFIKKGEEVAEKKIRRIKKLLK